MLKRVKIVISRLTVELASAPEKCVGHSNSHLAFNIIGAFCQVTCGITIHSFTEYRLPNLNILAQLILSTTDLSYSSFTVFYRIIPASARRSRWVLKMPFK